MSDTGLIDDFLLHRMEEGEAVLFEARLVFEPSLLEKMRWQKNTHDLVRAYGRKQMKAELHDINRKLFNEPAHEGFRQKIFRLFKR